VTVPHKQTTDDYIIYMWIQNAETGGLLGVREFSASDATPALTASIPFAVGKGLTIVPCMYSQAHGIWRGAALPTA
jgi:desulfoferrodoxin (superoxide reductase-like protein)